MQHQLGGAGKDLFKRAHQSCALAQFEKGADRQAANLHPHQIGQMCAPEPEPYGGGAAALQNENIGQKPRQIARVKRIARGRCRALTKPLPMLQNHAQTGMQHRGFMLGDGDDLAALC